MRVINIEKWRNSVKMGGVKSCSFHLMYFLSVKLFLNIFFSNTLSLKHLINERIMNNSRFNKTNQLQNSRIIFNLVPRIVNFSHLISSPQMASSANHHQQIMNSCYDVSTEKISQGSQMC